MKSKKPAEKDIENGNVKDSEVVFNTNQINFVGI